MKVARRNWILALLVGLLSTAAVLALQRVLTHKAGQPIEIVQWKTDWSRSLIDRSELQSGGPGKDGIPALMHP